jgi:lauroyl/myristoyl acyltransferase
LLFVNQGKSLIDRYYVAAGGSDIDLELRGYEKIQSHLAEGQKGMIFLTAHVGNWQVATTALRKLNRTVYLMMRPEDNVAVKETLKIDSEQEKIKVLYTDGSLGGVVEALKAISQGGIVSIMGTGPMGTVHGSVAARRKRPVPLRCVQPCGSSPMSCCGSVVGKGRREKIRD